MTQPLKQVTDLGILSSNDATAVTGDSFIVKTGLLHGSATAAKGGGLVGVCNTTTSAVGVSSIHVNKQDDKILRYAHPANSTIIAITKGNPSILEVETRDTKIVKGDFVTLTGSAVGGYNTTIKHVEVTKVVGSQRYNDYKTTITVDANTASLADFTGTATLFKSVIPILKPSSASGCELYINEVQLG